MLERLGAILTFFLFVTLFSPNLFFTLGLYSPIYAVQELALDFKRYDMTDHQIASANVLSILANILFGFVMFYAMQVRELSRFYQQQATNSKEQQVSHVLHSQSDSIVVV